MIASMERQTDFRKAAIRRRHFPRRPRQHRNTPLHGRTYHGTLCIGAYLEIADYIVDNDGRPARLRKANEMGEQLWQPVVEAKRGELDW